MGRRGWGEGVGVGPGGDEPEHGESMAGSLFMSACQQAHTHTHRNTFHISMNIKKFSGQNFSREF